MVYYYYYSSTSIDFLPSSFHTGIDFHFSHASCLVPPSRCPLMTAGRLGRSEQQRGEDSRRDIRSHRASSSSCTCEDCLSHRLSAIKICHSSGLSMLTRYIHYLPVLDITAILHKPSPSHLVSHLTNTCMHAHTNATRPRKKKRPSHPPARPNRAKATCSAMR